MTRIWYQSYVDPELHAPYFDRLREALATLADPEVEFAVFGLSPPDTHLHRLGELRCSIQVVENAIAAEEQGFDAFVIGHFQDAGLYEARCVVDIPVVGMGEATMLYGCQLGRSLGLITIDPAFVAYHWEQVDRYGLRDRVVAVAEMSSPVAEYMAAFQDAAARARVVEKFTARAQELVAAGAEVVIPAGGLFGTLTVSDSLRVDEALVLNPVAVAGAMAQVAAKLQRLNGTGASRAGSFEKAPAGAIAELRAMRARG